jgi:hypothetical protein
MTNDEARITNETQMTNDDDCCDTRSSFVIDSSFRLRHSELANAARAFVNCVRIRAPLSLFDFKLGVDRLFVLLAGGGAGGLRTGTRFCRTGAGA